MADSHGQKLLINDWVSTRHNKTVNAYIYVAPIQHQPRILFRFTKVTLNNWQHPILTFLGRIVWSRSSGRFIFRYCWWTVDYLLDTIKESKHKVVWQQLNVHLVTINSIQIHEWNCQKRQHHHCQFSDNYHFAQDSSVLFKSSDNADGPAIIHSTW